MKKQHFDVTGMSCSACVARVEKSVQKLAGVTKVEVALLQNRMQVQYDENKLSDEQIIRAVEAAGYQAACHQAKAKGTQTSEQDAEHKKLRTRLIASLVFTVPLFYLAMGHMMGWPMPAFLTDAQNSLFFALLQLALTLPVLIINGKYYVHGFKALFTGSPTMDSLIAIGSSAAVLYSLFGIWKMIDGTMHGNLSQVHHAMMDLYLESAAMIVALITLGKYLEARAKRRTSDAMTKLLDLAPKSARVLRDGQELTIPIEALVVGDIAIVKAGEAVPADGVLLQGSGALDESAITGESIPVDKAVGDTVIGATINRSGYFQMKVTETGEQTTLAQIIQLVEQASASKAPIAKLADKVSGIFVPVVIAIAVVATVVWLILGAEFTFALSIGISVLVISCPCALGLATPTAIMVGTGRGAAEGILIKSAQALEQLQSVDTVLLDKTGTITEGKPQVTDTRIFTAESDFWPWVTALEAMSEHPLAQAVVSYAESKDLQIPTVEDFLAIPGQGVQGVMDGVLCLGGNRVLLQSHGIDLKEVQTVMETWEQQGKTVLLFAKDGKAAGILAIADRVKQSSAAAIEWMQSQHLSVCMLTGDNATTARAIQKQVGVQEVMAQVLPQDKEQKVRRLQEQGHRVAMVGDGINDAPALVRADVGIAIGTGTDVAMESADIVLMKSELADVVTAIRLSRAVMRNIKENLFWAFFYNAIGIPLAAGVFYGWLGWQLNPMFAAAAMGLSSVCVVSNALRLRRFRSIPMVSVPSEVKEEKKMEKTMQIEGMMCQHCVAHVEKALLGVPGVAAVQVDLAQKNAKITADEQVEATTLQKAVEEAGYQVISVQ